jgi:hypothetical protein
MRNTEGGAAANSHHLHLNCETIFTLQTSMYYCHKSLHNCFNKLHISHVKINESLQSLIVYKL